MLQTECWTVPVALTAGRVEKYPGVLKIENLKNLIDGEWVASTTNDWIDVTNPATGEVIAKAPDSTIAEIDAAVSAAESAFENWRRVPAVERAQVLFRLKALMEETIEDLSAVITAENGKTLGESRGEVRRTIENVEVATGVPSLMMGIESRECFNRNR